MLLYHYLSSTSQRTSPLPVSLSLHLPVLLDESISGQMFSGALALLGQDMSPLPILWSRTELKLSWARDHMPEEFSPSPGEQPEATIILEGWHGQEWWDQEDAKQHVYTFYFDAMVSPEAVRKRGLATPTHAVRDFGPTVGRGWFNPRVG